MRAILSSVLLSSILVTPSPAPASAGAGAAAQDPTPPEFEATLERDHGRPSPGEGTFPYLIVTSRSLRSAFLPLVHERRRNGIPSVVRSMESLRGEYRAAADDAERVRLFLRDAHDHWGTRWVLLGGDTDVVPARFASVLDIVGDRSFVSDWYYACLDGTWDEDGDGRYGEPPWAGDPEDSPDLVPELYLGRAPVSDRREARDFVRRTLAYERRAETSFGHSTLLFANRLELYLDLAEYAEDLLPLLAADPAQQVTRLYESWNDPAWAPGAQPETRQSVLAALGEGPDLVVGYGGGGYEVLEAGARSGPDPQLLTVADILGLANGERAGHVFLATANVGAFDHSTSFAEAFLRAPAGGAVTVIAPSDVTFIAPTAALAHRFVEAVFGNDAPPIGQALVQARADAHATLAMAYHLLGDPLLRVRGGAASASALAVPIHPPGSAPRLDRPGRVPSRDVPTGPSLEVAAAARAVTPRAEPPRQVRLSAPIPTPSSISVRVEYSVAADREAGVRAEIVDLAGRRVRTLLGAGSVGTAGALTWDLRDASGRRVSPGVYLMRVRAGETSRTARLVVVAP